MEFSSDEVTNRFYANLEASFDYVFFGISIDNVSRSIQLTNIEVKEIYLNSANDLERAQNFAKLVNSKIEDLYGKEFNNVVTVNNSGAKPELKIDKPGSSVTLFEETGFTSLSKMGFTSGASNRNFSGKTVGDLFPGMFSQIVGASGISKDRLVFVDKDGNSVTRASESSPFVDKNGREVFVDKDGNSVFRINDSHYVDKNGKSVAIVDLTPLSADDVKPLLNETATVHINGTGITISSADSINQMVSKVNSSNAGVTLAYDAVNDKFVMTSKTEGSTGNFNENTIMVSSTNADGSHVLTATGNFLNALGIMELNEEGKIRFVDRQEGQNLRAIINGQEVVKFSNTFTIDGMTYTFNETFNSNIVYGHLYNEDEIAGLTKDVDYKEVNGKYWKLDNNGELVSEDKVGKVEVGNEPEIKIQVNKNIDDIVTTIKGFVDEYNKLIDHINTLMYQKKDRDFPPLSDDQKKAMKEEEIKAWEEKAKAGILAGDMDLRRLHDQLRRAIYENVEGAGISMADIGITTTANYKDGGRLVIDESKLREALDSKYDRVIELFTKSSDIPYGSGDQAQRYKQNGIANRLNDILSDAVRTTTIDGKKGSLVEKAGVLNDGTALTNQITKQIEQYDKRISVLIDRWKRQEQSYYQMFARMETMMMRLQTQQNNLASLMAQNGN